MLVPQREMLSHLNTKATLHLRAPVMLENIDVLLHLLPTGDRRVCAAAERRTGKTVLTPLARLMGKSEHDGRHANKCPALWQESVLGGCGWHQCRQGTFRENPRHPTLAVRGPQWGVQRLALDHG